MIQFQCPHCQAVLRVPDSAMGQRGKCPQCRAALLVPMPEELTGAKPQMASAGAATLSANPAPMPATATDPINDLFSALSDSGSFRTSDDPLNIHVRRSRSRSQGAFWTGLFFVTLAIGLGLAGYYWMKPRMQGELTAQRVSVDLLKPHFLPRRQLGDEKPFDQFLKSHGQDRLNINSQLLLTSIEATKSGLSLRLLPTDANDLYRVDVLVNGPLREYLAAHYAAMESQRGEQIAQAAQDFFEQMAAAESNLRGDPSSLLQIRDQLILPAAVDVLGWRMAAFVQGTQYPCVWQDQDDQLYFAVPAGTKQFEIREREIVGQPRQFPADLKFTIHIPVKNSPASPAPPAEQISLPEETPSAELQFKESLQDTPTPEGTLPSAGMMN